MSTKSKLEEAERLLDEARIDAKDNDNFELANTILLLLEGCGKALALADPGKAWMEETNAAWEGFSATGTGYMSRFAAKIGAGELRKYAKRMNYVPASNTVLFQQIADLEAIAEGGGE